MYLNFVNKLNTKKQSLDKDSDNVIKQQNLSVICNKK